MKHISFQIFQYGSSMKAKNTSRYFLNSIFTEKYETRLKLRLFFPGNILSISVYKYYPYSLHLKHPGPHYSKSGFLVFSQCNQAPLPSMPYELYEA